MLKNQGVKRTLDKITFIKQLGIPMGNSAAGVVIDAGSEIKDIKKDDLVACAGSGIANHAEFISVPRNLLVKIPENLDLASASTVTLGSIALQGVRRADPKLGEFVAVIGLGMLGQLTVQMLKACGCRVVGVDLDSERIEIALKSGMDMGLNGESETLESEVVRFSRGYGVDSVIITAATKSSEVINSAMKMCRKKGRVVIVGDVGLGLQRQDFYNKELDVLISTSYGPGRYDEKYESKGLEYPYAYVRWTENRNLEEYLRLLSVGQIHLEPLMGRIFPVEEVTSAYEALKSPQDKPLIAILRYNPPERVEKKLVISEFQRNRERLNIAIIGAGSFAKGAHLPNLEKLKKLYNIYAVVGRTGYNASQVARQFGASLAGTDYDEILKDENVDVVLISTRHNLHADMAIKAARAGKAILLEKPVALSRDDLTRLKETLEETKVPFTVGFNRRFSPISRQILEAVKDRVNPMMINYRMNAGFIPTDHWIQTEEGGGRNIGEACHIYDLFTYLTNARMVSVEAVSLEAASEQVLSNDNFAATIKYSDGSICNLVYTALGNNQVSKEQMDIYFDGKIITMDDYCRLKFYGFKGPEVDREQDKGLLDELEEFYRSIREGSGYPVPLWQLIEATEISFAVEEKLMK